MIRNILFDFGDVFINLDKDVMKKAIPEYGGAQDIKNLQQLNNLYETGAISTDAFITGIQKIYPHLTHGEIIGIWNSMLLDLPDHRLHFLKELAAAQKYRLFLLSNTNSLHISHIQQHMGMDVFQGFKSCFEKFYLSHEIHMRKPDTEVFQFVMDENHLKAHETLFIDDTLENIQSADTLGLQTWLLQVGVEDIVDLTDKL
ncbi:MAG: HAD family hydrolase [Flavobacteriaceae bacterium]